MKSKLILFLFVAYSSSLLAQSIDYIKANRQQYIWGEGSGETKREAERHALAEIISQISTQVESSFEKVIQDEGTKYTKKVKEVLKTYSNVTLTNTECIDIENEPDAKVFLFMERAEVHKVFESRKNKIIAFAQEGEQALKRLQIADALRNFYWAQTLLRSHPDNNSIQMTAVDGNEVLLMPWLSAQINAVFSHLTINIADKEKKGNYVGYILHLLYDNQPVKNLDYTFWSGQNWTNIYSAKDGLGYAELTSINETDELKLKIEYAFEGESAIDIELRDVMERLPQIPYRNAYLTANHSKSNETTSAVAAEVSTVGGLETKAVANMAENLAVLSNTTAQEAVLNKVLTAIANNRIVSYNRLSKEQYLRNLQHSFKSNEFINIRFADNNVVKSGKGDEVYGIQIKQDYFSTNYGDTGYLFLLIDMTDSISPTIHIRTWQPEKNPDGSIYGVGDF